MVIDNDRAMIVMEMVPGGGLDHYLKNNQVIVEDRCSYAFDVSLGLYYLHNKRCMHRQAPEVVTTLIYTKECDVYSYGILVWEIFNDAKEPFDEYSNKTVRHRLTDPKFRPPLSSDMPVEIRIIVAACWNPVPEGRPLMKDVAWILKKFVRHTVPGDDQNRAPPVPARQAQAAGSTLGSPRRLDGSTRKVRSRMDSRRGRTTQLRKYASNASAPVRRERRHMKTLHE
ncbi:hypothetical protein TELCIR_07947 [Teladorsagia circumcincta]|uniref:Protein kinase domain-containing protein n=1 Tax=Teladorsagia circumcincta TaxID=45464 RepID=A0A2G9UJ49_TELCI|nr:hypothetical protein TELCIR_07947 [Teladorsagia circumcincta]